MQFGVKDSCTAEQRIDLDIGSTNPKVAVDGNSMVIVTQNSNYQDFPTNIAFYSRTNDEWVLVTSVWEEHYGYDYSVALSGDTVMFAFETAEHPVIYDQMSGSWIRRDYGLEDLLAFNDQPNYEPPGLGLDKDLACMCQQSCKIYRRDIMAGRWLLAAAVDMDGHRCVVAGNSVAIYNERDGLKMYRYDQDLNKVTAVQDYFIPAYYGFTLNEKHLVYSNIDGSVSILQRQSDYEPYAFLQELELEEHTGVLAIYGKVLIIGEYDQTTMYYQNDDDFWEEVGEVDEIYYDYQLSDSILLGIKGNALDSYNLKDCIPEINQMLPTKPPTSSSDSVCHDVEILVEYKKCPDFISWHLKKNETDHWHEVASYNETNANATHHLGYLCLEGGDYRFHIVVDGGLCSSWPYDHGVDYYAIRKSDGVVIEERYNIQSNETKRFSLP